MASTPGTMSGRALSSVIDGDLTVFDDARPRSAGGLGATLGLGFVVGIAIEVLLVAPKRGAPPRFLPAGESTDAAVAAGSDADDGDLYGEDGMLCLRWGMLGTCRCGLERDFESEAAVGVVTSWALARCNGVAGALALMDARGVLAMPGEFGELISPGVLGSALLISGGCGACGFEAAFEPETEKMRKEETIAQVKGTDELCRKTFIPKEAFVPWL